MTPAVKDLPLVLPFPPPCTEEALQHFRNVRERRAFLWPGDTFWYLSALYTLVQTPVSVMTESTTCLVLIF